MPGPYVTPSCPLPAQCLSAVRTVQSLACLEEADHTVGFVLQLSSFMKEWHFHLPQLLRDVQVRLRLQFLAGPGETGTVQRALSGAPAVSCAQRAQDLVSHCFPWS